MADEATATDAKPEQPRPKTRWLRLIAFVIGAYVAFVLLIMLLEDSFIYYPMPASQGWLKPHASTEDVSLQSADGTSIHAWWCPYPGAKGALLFCHGNAGNLSHRRGLIDALQETLHQSVLIFDYPGYGKSAGKPSEAGCYAAGNAAYDWLTQTKKVPPAEVILFGESLGGGVAIELATTRPHRALVLLKTFTSVPDMAQRQFPIIPARWLARNRYDNLDKIGRCPRPIFIASGAADSLIPAAHGQRLYEAAPEPKQFLLMEGDHNDPLTREFLSELKKFLETKAGQ